MNADKTEQTEEKGKNPILAKNNLEDFWNPDDEGKIEIDFVEIIPDPSGASWLGTGFTDLGSELDALGIKQEPLEPFDSNTPDIFTEEGYRTFLEELEHALGPIFPGNPEQKQVFEPAVPNTQETPSYHESWDARNRPRRKHKAVAQSLLLSCGGILLASGTAFAILWALAAKPKKG
jgi:hypothetical protein